MSDWPAIGTPPSIFISPFSELSMGTEYGALATAAPASTATGTANLARAYPFVLPEPMLVVKLWAYNGATLGGNHDIGIYTEDWTRIVSTGAVAQAGTSALQEHDITDTMLGRGRYYLALSNTTTTATYFSNVISIVLAKALGWAQMASANPLPATITPAAYTAAIQPVFGLSARTLVA